MREIVEQGVQPIVDLLKEFDEINAKFGEPMSDDEMDEAARTPGQGSGKARRHRRLGPGCAAGDGDGCSALSAAGNSSCRFFRVAKSGASRLCRLLLQKPDILLLDEPTNHLDAESVAWLEHHIQQYAGTVIAVTHDRYFLDNVAGWILELDRGHGIPWEGNYSSWLEQKQARLAAGRKTETRAAKDTCSASWNGSACRPKDATPKARRASIPMKRC